MTRRILIGILAVALLCPGSVMAEPGLDLEALTKESPGWLLTGRTGDATQGSIEAEQIIWPLFYVHWFPLKETVGRKLTADKVAKAIEDLWDGLVLDEALEPEPYTLAMHEGFTVQVSAQRGELKVRYYVWACPESGRLFIVDTSLNLLANAPDLLLGWMKSMADTVRCHRGATVREYPFLPTTYEVPGGDVAYSHPWSWRPLKAYRINTTFSGTNFRADSTEGITFERGQDLIFPGDAVRRLTVIWRPAYDYPLSFDVAIQRAQDFWRDRAQNFLYQQTLTEDDVWIVDGIVQQERLPSDVPPTHMWKFRSWVWRVGDTEFLAVGSVGGIRFGRQRPGLELPEWIKTFQQIFARIRVN